MTAAAYPAGVAGRLGGARRVAFVTGAGMSTDSGIPTYRGGGGLWRNHDPMRLATIAAFDEDPRLVWEWYEDRIRNAAGARPNAGHAAIAELEGFAEVAVLTQNIDGLHGRAGSTRVVELHGNITRVRCTRCGFAGPAEPPYARLPPACGACGGILRPDVVWFGEGLRGGVWDEAVGHACAVDAVVVAGTSLAVGPANTLPARAKRAGALLVEVNPEPTPWSGIMDLCVREPASRALPGLVGLFRGRGGGR